MQRQSLRNQRKKQREKIKLAEYRKADKEGRAEIPGGIGEEDMVTIVLPYLRTAREGVKRLGSLLERYGTYEKSGIAFNNTYN